MPNFKYIARTKQGKLEQGFLEAKNEDELVGILQGRGLIVTSFEPAVKARLKARREKRFHTRVKLDDMIVFSRQLTTLIDAGITLLRSLEITAEQITSRRLHIVLKEIRKDVAAGGSFKDAIAKHPGIFSKFWINIVEAGESSGQLGFALKQLTQYLEATAGFKRKIISALTYPAVILSVAIVAILVFIIRIIPMFSNIYSGFGAQLPVFTRIVFNISGVIKRYILLMFGAVVGIIFLFRYYIRTPLGRSNIDKLLLGIPIIGNIVRQIEAVRFASGLAMLIKSGSPFLLALDIMLVS
ncbi:MAG: type II secretion system F family protein, partial [Candidatus Omnitrophota bacterium]